MKFVQKMYSTYEGTPIESPINFFYWKYAPFFHILNDDMYMMLSMCCFWIFHVQRQLLGSKNFCWVTKIDILVSSAGKWQLQQKCYVLSL
jgi:hypothetical protein